MELNSIYRGDCLTVLSEKFTHIDKYFSDVGYGLPKEFVDLIYLDPPFFSNRDYEQPWGDESKTIGFDDNDWGYGVDGLHGKYLPYMRERIQKCYNVLKKTGSFYLHCDWHAGHYLKQICDDIFGYNNFQNEVIWSYPQSIKSSRNKFLSNHDVLFFYTKTNLYVFNPQINDYTEKQLKRFKHEDEHGNFYYDTRRDAQNNKKRVKVYLKKQGTPVGSVWYYSRVQGNESEGYPTQKPEALLERIIQASSNPGEIIFDPFCGCGTTLAVACKLNRNYIGIDLSEKACRVVIDRLKKLGATPKFHNSVYTVDMLKQLPPMQFQDYIIDICLKGHSKIRKTGDKGIDGFTDDGIPIQVKQSSITRPVIDEFETAIDRCYNQIGNTTRNKEGWVVGDGVPSDGVWREIREAKEQRNIIIKHISIQECCNLLNDRMRQMEVMEGWDKPKPL